jgi:hypothetical protein
MKQRILVFYDMTLYHWIIGSQHLSGCNIIFQKKRILHQTTVKTHKLSSNGFLSSYKYRVAEVTFK